MIGLPQLLHRLCKRRTLTLALLDEVNAQYVLQALCLPIQASPMEATRGWHELPEMLGCKVCAPVCCAPRATGPSPHPHSECLTGGPRCVHRR